MDANGTITDALYIDGRLYHGSAKEEAMLALTDRGLLLGDGLFETLPILQGTPLWWPDHRTRLLESANGIDLNIDRDALDELVLLLSKASHQANVILRISTTRGSGGRGLMPPTQTPSTLFASVTPMPETMAFDCLSLRTSEIRRNETAPTSRIKSLNYLDNILAAKRAAEAGADDALLLNSQGKACCSTIGNLFGLFGNELVTPPVSDGVLPGIMRGKLLQFASDLGITACEQSLTLEDIKKADGLFLTNSLRIIRRVSRLDDTTFAKRGDDVIEKLQRHMRQRIQQETGVTLGQRPAA